MSGPLPDDPREWPTDPYEILGVVRGIDARSLRKAYIERVRAYKPELFPEQFRIIRAAYEALSNRAAQIDLSNQFIHTPTEVQQFQPARTDRRRKQPADEADSLWQQALAGDVEPAFAGLRALHDRQPQRCDVLLRLYWLAVVFPEAERVRPAAEWLTIAMSNSGLTGPASELYRRELATRPGETLRAGLSFNSTSTTTARLAEVTGWRWRAAASISRFDIIENEFTSIRSLIQPADEEAWVGLLFTAMDVLAWNTDGPLGANCVNLVRNEINNHMHLGLRLEAAFDRYDYLTMASAGWRDLAPNPACPNVLTTLIPKLWQRSAQDNEPALLALLPHIEAWPSDWLHTFDFIEANSPGVMSTLWQCLEKLQVRLGETTEANAPIDAAPAIDMFFQQRLLTPYAHIRQATLKFCLSEMISPEQLMLNLPIAPAVGDPHNRTLPHALAEDRPLRLVCLAHRLFWTQARQG